MYMHIHIYAPIFHYCNLHIKILTYSNGRIICCRTNSSTNKAREVEQTLRQTNKQSTPVTSNQ